MKYEKEGLTYKCSTKPDDEPLIVESRGEVGLSYMVRIEPAFEPPGDPLKFFPGVLMLHGIGIRPHVKQGDKYIQFEVSRTAERELSDTENKEALEAGILGMMAVLNAFDDPEAAQPYFYPQH